MNAQILINSTVRQVTVLIAQLATSGGIRAPLAQVANQVFVDLARELEAQGVSRKVSADMFGMALRAYIRKVRRLTEGETDSGKTLWQALYEFVQEEGMVTRARIMQRFKNDGEVEVSSLLKDLTDSGLVFATGAGAAALYRMANEAERREYFQLTRDDGLEEMAWVLVYREGPLSVSALGEALSLEGEALREVVTKLSKSHRIIENRGLLSAEKFMIPLGTSRGWEASVFDHLQAVVQTICARLRVLDVAGVGEETGGSTFSYNIWPGHPMESEVRQQLAQHRARLKDLKDRVERHNGSAPRPNEHERVTAYVGQSSISMSSEEKEK